MTWIFALIMAGAPLEAPAAGTLPQSPALHWLADLSRTNEWHLEVSGLEPSTLQALREAHWDAAQWQRLLPVYAGSESGPQDAVLPPMLGSYRFISNGISFESQFALEPEVKYRAVFRPDQLPGHQRSNGSPPIVALFQIPVASSTPSTIVSQVYPSGSVVPENLLKFYIHFSAAMSRGHIYDHLHLRSETGKWVELPFLELEEELWNPEMTRLTLFIDPGRIKRGVTPLEELGPALENGKRFTLEVDRDWKDAHGLPLREAFRKSFRVGPPDRVPPDPKRWRIAVPPAGSVKPLKVTFSEPMDHALAQRMIHVLRPAGTIVAGTAELEQHEERWSFAPSWPWDKGSYRILVQTTIEDLAGNNIGKSFEVDLFEGVQRRFTNATIALPIEVR